VWSYYGSKSKLVRYYPPPKYIKIIEPFAGSARYSLEYWNHDILLIEKYELLVKLWHWLQKAKKEDILKLPNMQPGQNTDNFEFDSQEAKWLMGFMIQGGVNAPRKTVSSVGNFGRSVARDKKRISESLSKIRKWNILYGDYRDAPDVEATWFIDPPYQHGGEYYYLGNKNIDYEELAEWCKSRKGQVIVCENSKADWMDFKPLKELHGSKNRTLEVIWYNNG